MRQIDTTLFQGTQHNMEGCCFVHFLVSLHNWNVVKYLFIVQSVMLHFSHKVNWITGLKYVHNLIISCTHFEKIFILTTSLPEHDKTRDMQHTELNEDTMSWGGSIHPKLRCFFLFVLSPFKIRGQQVALGSVDTVSEWGMLWKESYGLRQPTRNENQKGSSIVPPLIALSARSTKWRSSWKDQ